ncbi:hypothetical protein PPL_09561 [Heterostelium album PN500]|uniref:Uncharacterized protein n=1 Tax=Heterostelium pallidum (strain ATCC 26659 / Pp 5 / PN500) TaxID=670386 RepID=D3BNE9_HETP5|nr:hypothetical protein PPL_09561 [Heterostelium album PN500]EFA76809.1 hypothetical protein PPL_09561 [Heterostelium album PN500]|eukprot:XP_020428941.1 hypothetical protein PPL_09561 [Heterostelium album PN500]
MNIKEISNELLEVVKMKSTTILLVSAIVLCFALASLSQSTVQYCEYCTEEDQCDTSVPLKCVNLNTTECTLFTDPCGFIPEPYYVYIHPAIPEVKITLFLDQVCREPISEPTKYTCGDCVSGGFFNCSSKFE